MVFVGQLFDEATGSFPDWECDLLEIQILLSECVCTGGEVGGARLRLCFVCMKIGLDFIFNSYTFSHSFACFAFLSQVLTM